jgi:dGTPase
MRLAIDGLNLTRGTLSGILKYPWHRDTGGGHRTRKWGAYHSEQADFTFARERSKDKGDEPSLEAQIMTWADDLTYSVHDLEDFYQAGLIPLDRLSTEQEATRFLAGVSERWDKKDIKSPYKVEDLARVFRNLFETSPIKEPYTGERRQQAALRTFTQGRIEEYVSRTTLGEPGASGGALVRDDAIKMEVEILKELLWYYVINNPALATQEYGQGQTIERLFSIVADAAVSKSSDRWNILPGRARELIKRLRVEQGESVEEKQLLRVACDTVAGMTEQQVVQMYHRLTGVAPGSLFQPIVL